MFVDQLHQFIHPSIRPADGQSTTAFATSQLVLRDLMLSLQRTVQANGTDRQTILVINEE